MNLKEMYGEMEAHLLYDEKPSEYLEKAGESEAFGLFPLSLLDQMKKTGQSPQYHPEGNVWIHTMMVVDAAAGHRKFSRNPRVFMWAALLHDIGKPKTTRKRKGKITSYNHDIEGEKLAREFLEAFTEDKVFIEEVCSLVRYHMQILFVSKGPAYAQLNEMRQRTDIREAALFGYCDRIGRAGVDAGRERENIRKFLREADVPEQDLGIIF